MKSFNELYSGFLNRVQEDIVNTGTPASPTPTNTTPTSTGSTTPTAPPTTTSATANHALVTQIATMKDPAAIATLLQKNNVLLPINPTK